MELARPTSTRGVSARDAYSDLSPLTSLPHRKDRMSRTRVTPVLAQKKSGFPTSGTVKFKSTPESPKKSFFGTGKRPGGTVQLTGSKSLRGRPGQRDAKTVFIAGALGSLGARIVKELLSLGFKIRAGCASVEEAQKDLEVAVRYGIVAGNASRGVSFVPIDWSDKDSVAFALGSAGKVVFTGEGGPGKACVDFIGLCEETNVSQFLLVLSPAGKTGTSFIGGSGGGSSLKQAQGVLENSNLSFTVIQPGNMDRATEEFESTNNVVLGDRPGQVSLNQVAELIGSCLLSPTLAENKLLNVGTDPTAPSVPYEDLLIKINPIITKEEQLAREAEKEKLKQEIAGLMDKVMRLEGEEEDAKERVNAYKERIKDLQSTQRAKNNEASSMLRSSSQVERQLDALIRQVDNQNVEEVVAKALYIAAQKAQREGRLLTREEENEIAFAAANPEAAAEEEQRRIEQEEAEAAAAKAAQEKEEKLKAEAEKKLEAAKLAAEKAAKAKAEQEAKLAKAKAEQQAKLANAKAQQEARAKAAAEEKKKREAAVAAAKAAKEKEEEEKKKAKEAALLKAAEDEKKRKEEEAAKATALAEKKEEEAAKQAEIEAAEKKAREAAEAKAAKAEEARLAAEANKKEAEAARLKKQEAVKAKAATRVQSSGGFNLFGSWKAPWIAAPSVSTDGDRPTAKEWIESWRARQRGEITAEEWIKNWRAKQPTKT